MADFTDHDKELLDKLRKAFEKKGKTRLVLEPWDEHFDRDVESNAARSVLAAKIVEGFSGSWAAQYHFGWGSQVQEATAAGIQPLADNDPDGPPVPIRAKTNHVGQRGMPELNFAPYNWRTNTLGSKGPSVVGHPISFEVVGPTLKSPFCDWTWDVDEGAGPNGGDFLTPSVRPDGAVSPLVNEIADMYGPMINGTWTIGDAAEPNGGLYLLVADDGANAGALAVGQTPMGALPNYVDTARYELFRISEITDFSIEIHPNKSFSNFFDLPAVSTRNIRAITIIKPYVTRLQAVPQSGATGGNDGTSTSGREQTFVVLSPERAATNDNYPPYLGAGGPGVGDGSWRGGGFSEARAPGSVGEIGAIAAYGGTVRLPIPIPVLEVNGTVEQDVAAFPIPDIGQWAVETGLAPWTAPPFSPASLPIVRISATFRNSDLPGFAFGSVESCMGWFDVFGTAANGFTGIVLNRVPETDPRTGLTYWGPGPYISSVAVPSVAVGMTLHQAVDTIWNNPVYQADKVEAARIKNIIDPTWVERFEKQLSDPTLAGGQAPPPPASGPGRPDKAIFDTRTFFGAGLPQAADPGNLMDLGFRTVFFPIKEDPNDATRGIPDFNNPITSREVVIDGSITEKQWIDMDYSAGLVRLSHPPPTSRSGIPDEPSEIIPNGIQGDTAAGNNPRGEVVLFAACVPYSMEPGQAGTGSRITTNENGPRDTDASSEQFIATIDQDNTTFLPVPPFIGVSGLTGAVDIVLDRALDCPETGVITINSGNADSPAFGRWTYSEKKSVLTAAGFRTALGLLSSNPSATDPSPAAGPVEPRGVIIRREVIPYEQSLDLQGLSDLYIGDTTYGSSLRTETLRFKNALTQYNMDGSVTIDPRTPGYMWNQQGQWGTSGIFVGPGDVRRISDTGLLGGVFYQNLAGGTDATPDPTNGATVLDKNGQYTIVFSSGAGDFNGIVTRKSLIYLQHNFRLVMKFRLNADATPTINQFLGLIGPADLTGPPPATSLVFNAAVSPPTPTFSYLGLRFDGAFPAAPATFFAQNVLTPGSAQTHATTQPWSNFQNSTHYLVIETEPFFDLALPPGVSPGAGAYVKMAIFDEDFNELARTRFYDQSAVPYDTAMELVFANWSGPGGGVLEVHFYDAVIVNKTELPFLTIP